MADEVHFAEDNVHESVSLCQLPLGNGVVGVEPLLEKGGFIFPMDKKPRLSGREHQKLTMHNEFFYKPPNHVSIFIPSKAQYILL